MQPISLPDHVRRYIQREALIRGGQTILVAVSGGVDSVVLLDVLARCRGRLGCTLHVAHVHHGLRGAEADADARFVQEIAQRRELPCTVVRAVVETDGATASPEAVARQVRYRELSRVASGVGAAAVALAHSRDDQAETVLMRILRGTGVRGLAGMLPKTAWCGTVLVRPLLDTARHLVVAYASAAGLAYRHDRSNDDPGHLRNRLRQEVLPYLGRNFNLDLSRALADLAEIARWDAGLLDAAGAEAFDRLVVSKGPGFVELDRQGFVSAPVAVRRLVAREALGHVKGSLSRVGFVHWRQLERLLSESPNGAVTHLPDGVAVQAGRDRIRFRRSR